MTGGPFEAVRRANRKLAFAQIEGHLIAQIGLVLGQAQMLDREPALGFQGIG